MSLSSVAVAVGDTTITEEATITASGRIMTIEIPNLLSIDGLEIEKGDAVTITYQAHLNGSAVLGSTGQATTMTRTYTSDPVTLGTTSSAALSVRNFTYQAEITKLDKSNGAPLEDVTFTIAASTDYGTGTQYVQSDGSLGTTAHVFATGADGKFSVSGLDEGTYTIHEVAPLSGYLAPGSDAVLSISSALDATNQTITYHAAVTGGEAVVVDGDIPTTLTTQDASTGKAFVQIVNEREFAMPITGLKGNWAVYAIAAALGVMGGLAVFAGARRKRGESQG